MKNIYMNKLKCKSNLQLTLDDDFNVPDIKPDIEIIIKEQGNVIIEDIKSMNGKLSVKGVVAFNILYLSEEEKNPIHNITGTIPFDEIINVKEGCISDDPLIKCTLNDLSTTLINSRKMRVNAIINLDLSVEEIADQEIAIGMEIEDDVQFINKRIEITELIINKKDTYRIKEDLQIPTSKENVFELLYSEISANAVDIRLLEDKFSIKGEIPVFIIYKSDNEESPLNYYETVVSFSGIVECAGCNEEMIEDISWIITSKLVNIREDLDGEDRVIDIEVIMGLNVKVYEVEEPEILHDIYCPDKEIIPIYREANYENIIIKNNSKHRVNDRIKVPSKQPSILQICNANSEVKIDDISIGDNELTVEGVIDVSILYVSEDDSKPINSLQGMVPFTQSVEVKGINEDSKYDIRPSVDQLSVIVMDSDEVEIKAIINLNTIAFENVKELVITDVEINELDVKKLQAIPGLVAYVVKENDSLWDIAKNNYTTIDLIKELNNIEEDNISAGDKILIMKKTLTIA